MQESGTAGEAAEAGRGDFRFSPRPNRAGEIRWLPWGEEAFARASREEKPVLLSISAVWCHWCHVMDETTYSDPEVIDLVNRNYVPVRVDNDRHPDINSRYNQGGWPTTAFLSSRGVLLAGTTYVPPDTMRKVLARIFDLYRRNRPQLENAGADIAAGESVREHGWPSPGNARLDPFLSDTVSTSLLAAWDREYGGLGTEPKFPFPEALSLALHVYRRGMGDEYLALAAQSLRAMIRGNLRDHVEGGFFRYSTKRDWSVPHYEKMLGDNALLVSLLLRACGATGEMLFLNAAAETASYIYHILSDGKRRFFGSQDADEGYYLLDASQRKGATPPAVDTTVYIDVSSRAASSLLEAGTVLGKPEYVELALNFLDFAWKEAYLEGEGMAHYHDGAPHRRGLLDDQAEAALALQRAYALTGDELYLRRAGTLLALIRGAFWDKESNLLFDTASGFSPTGLRPEPAKPGSAALAAEAMLIHGYITGKSIWRIPAEKIIAGAGAEAPGSTLFAASLALASELALGGPLLVKVRERDARKRDLLIVAALLSPDHRVITLAAPESNVVTENVAGADVCGEHSCYLHSERPEDLAAYLGVDTGIMESVDRWRRTLT